MRLPFSILQNTRMSIYKSSCTAVRITFLAQLQHLALQHFNTLIPVKLLVIPALLLTSMLTNAQEKLEPTVLYLYPREVEMSDAVKNDLAAYNKETEITDEVRNNFIQPGLAPNWKSIRSKELEFIQKQDFVTVFVVALSRELAYKELEYHPNLLIFPWKETSASDKVSYKKLADKFDMSWLVNIPKVELTQDASGKHMKVSIQLFNTLTGWIFLDTSYTVDSSSIGSCEEDDWYCMVERIKVPITRDIADKVDKNRHHHK